MTGYRQLTPDEIVQLGQEIENYRRWENVRKFAAMIYPPEAHQVSVSVTSAYNDNTYDDDVSVIVTDESGEQLSYDLTRPWWMQFSFTAEAMRELREDKSGLLSNIGGPARDAIIALCADLLGVEMFETWEPRDPISYTYLLDTAPTISYPQVYTPE